MTEMSIGELAREAGVHVETVRYYQRRGLMEEPGRRSGTIRRYGVDAVKRLRFVRRAQELGFTLEEIKSLIELGDARNCRGARELAARKLAVVNARIADLRRMQQALGGLMEQCDQGRKLGCPIIDSLSGGGLSNPFDGDLRPAERPTATATGGRNGRTEIEGA